MKNVLMIFFFAAGFAISSADAQKCTPCPPECVMAPCASACKGSAGAAAVNVKPEGVASFASFSPEAITAACSAEKMSGKDMKACEAKCTGNKSTLIPGGTSVSAPQGCTPAPVCQGKGASVASPAPASAPKPIKQ